MPDQPGEASAARFVLSIDGAEIGRFEVLMITTASHSRPRRIQAHELPLALAKTQELRVGKVSMTDHGFDVPDKTGTNRGGTALRLVLKRGWVRQAGLGRLKTLSGAGRSARIVLTSLDAAGRPLGRHDVGVARPAKVTAPALDAKGGGDIPIEEIVIDHESVRLEPSGSDRRRDQHKP